MKTLATTLLLVATSAVPLLAEAASIKIDIRYKGVDAKWFSDLSTRTKEAIQDESGGIVLPGITARSGELTTLELIREYRLDNSTLEGPVIRCGVILEFTPKADGGAIRLTGKGVLRRSTDKGAGGVATKFEAKENRINLQLDVGAPKVVDLAGGGQMILAATLIDATGRPIKK